MTIVTITLSVTLVCFAMKQGVVSKKRRWERDALRMKPVEGKACVYLRQHFPHMELARKSFLNQMIA